MSITPTCGTAAPNQIRMLVQRRTDEQTAIRTAVDGELWRRGVLVVDQPLAGPCKIVEDVLLVQRDPPFHQSLPYSLPPRIHATA